MTFDYAQDKRTSLLNRMMAIGMAVCLLANIVSGSAFRVSDLPTRNSELGTRNAVQKLAFASQALAAPLLQRFLKSFDSGVCSGLMRKSAKALRHVPRYTYSVVTGSLAYYWTHRNLWLSIMVATTLILPLAWTLLTDAADQPRRVSLLRDDKAFRRTLQVLLVGQLLVPVPWALPFLANEILGIHSIGLAWAVGLLGAGFWVGNQIGAFVQKKWDIARHRNLAWQAGFIGSGLLMIFMAAPLQPWVWYSAMVALGMTMSMGFIVTKTMVRDQPESIQKHADVLYDLFVYGGAAAGVLLFSWLAAGIGPAQAMIVNGSMLAVFELFLAFPDLLNTLLRRKIPPITRKALVRRPWRTLTLIFGVQMGIRYHSWETGVLSMMAAGISMLLANLISKIGLPRIGHDEKLRIQQNLVYPEPPADSKRGLSKPGNPRSVEPFVWQGDAEMMLEDGTPIRELDTLVLSDTHFNDTHMQEELLMDFLKHHTFKRLILLGDIVDYQIRRPLTPMQKEILRHISRLAEQGVDIIYVPGNHDKQWRQNAARGLPVDFRNENGDILLSVRAVLEYQWILPDGRKAHAIHGDKFDDLTFLQRIGAWVYDHLLDVDNWTKRERRLLNLFSEFYIGKLAKRLAKGYLRTSRKKLGEDALLHEATVGFAGHTHDGEIRVLKIRHPITGETIPVTVVNTDNSQNPIHVGAVGIRPMRGRPDDGRIELYQWKKVLGRGSMSEQAPEPSMVFQEMQRAA